MLTIAIYTYKEITEVFHTTRMDSIKRSLTTLGFKYNVVGRGQKALFHITETPNRFKMFAMKELGIAAQTNFDALKIFMYAYFCDENFSNLMHIDMKETLNSNYGLEVSQQTISRWIDKLVSLDLTHESVEYSYYVSIVSYVTATKERETEEITHEQFLNAWSAYWAAMTLTGCYNDAFNAMTKSVGGKVFKVNKREQNGFTAELLQRLITVLTD